MVNNRASERFDEVFGRLSATVDMMKVNMDIIIRDIKGINKRLEEISSDIAVLKFKSSMWGVVGGLIAAVGVMLLSLLK
jgi:hypothetical protein